MDTRIEWLLNMDEYLSSFYEPNKYPMNITHIKGLPITTYQAIRHNVATRIQLYWLSKNKTYNHRAISTLAVESFFSDLASLATNNSGIPFSADIPHYLAKVTQMNSIKHDPTK